jgi:hypothetical protein
VRALATTTTQMGARTARSLPLRAALVRPAKGARGGRGRLSTGRGGGGGVVRARLGGPDNPSDEAESVGEDGVFATLESGSALVMEAVDKMAARYDW